jgi:hypothetical protein
VVAVEKEEGVVGVIVALIVTVVVLVAASLPWASGLQPRLLVKLHSSRHQWVRQRQVASCRSSSCFRSGSASSWADNTRALTRFAVIVSLCHTCDHHEDGMHA